MQTPEAAPHVSGIYRYAVKGLTPERLDSVELKPGEPLPFDDGLPPWAELDWMDKEIGIGPARLKVFARTTRCAAANVDPETGARDMAIPATLLSNWGHQNFGSYATVAIAGAIGAGTPVTGPEGR